MATAKNTPAEDAIEAEAAPEVTTPVVDDDVLDRELERIITDESAPLKLADGTYVIVRPLKLKELFAAFKIITRGAAMSMGALSFSLLQDTQDQFAETLIALLINAIPEADQEFAEFLRVVVDPDTPEGGWPDRDAKAEAESHLDYLFLGDPEVDDAIDILTVLITREAKDIQRLGKKVANAAKMFGKVAPLRQK